MFKKNVIFDETNFYFMFVAVVTFGLSVASKFDLLTSFITGVFVYIFLKFTFFVFSCLVKILRGAR